jgi:hypothetical protein
MSDSLEFQLSRAFMVRKGPRYSRAHLAGALFGAGFIVLLVELGGIWNEVHEIRLVQANEVRERTHVRPRPDVKQVRRTYESTSNVEVDRSVDSTIGDQPIEVEVDRAAF